MSAYLDTLPEDISAEERAYHEGFYNSMPVHLQQIVDEASLITEAKTATIQQSVGLIDHTSLKDDGEVPMVGVETEEDIIALCEAAKGQDGLSTAAVCVYPNQIAVAKKALTGSNVKLAVVNNFPHGDFSPEDIAEDAAKSVAQGVDEIDTVIDYEQFHEWFAAQDLDHGINAFQNTDAADIRAIVNLMTAEGSTFSHKLQAVAQACQDGQVALKTILKASTFETYDSLYTAATIADQQGADFVKTCTGKLPNGDYGIGKPDASTLLTAATVMQAVKDGDQGTGVKISGGVKYPVDCERMKYLVDNILGPEHFGADTFRFGASSLLKNLEAELAPASPKTKPWVGPSGPPNGLDY